MNKEFTIELITPMLGTVPKNQEIYTDFIATKNPNGIDNDEIQTVEEIEEKGWTGFHSDTEGIFVYDYFIKGFLKNAGNVLKEELKIKAMRSKISDYAFVMPRKIYIAKNVDGVIERPLRAQTAQGPRVALARSDFVKEGTQIKFSIELLSHKEITWEVINRLFEYGQLQGLGQFRNGGYGRFKVVVKYS